MRACASLRTRGLALALAALLALPGCDVGQGLPASAGAPRYQRDNFVPVPGGRVNAAGGNLLLERLDLSVDTPMGAQALGAIYDALSGVWRWNFELSFDGAVFVDPTGAVHEVGALADGAPIPGSIWIKVDSRSIETRGGLAYHFDAAGRLEHLAWRSGSYPRIEYGWSAERLELAHCTRADACLAFAEVEMDGAGRPVLLSDTRSGRRAELDWDGLGRLTAARSPQDVAAGRPGFRYEYSPGGTLLTALTNSEGERVEYDYQTARRIASVTQVGEEQPQHRFYFFGPDFEGLYPTLHRDPVGAETRLLFDAERRLRRVEWLETGEVMLQEWSGRRVVRRVEPGGVVTEFVWESEDLVAVIEPSGNQLLRSYEPQAVDPEQPEERPLRRVEDSLGLVEERSYDAQGRLGAQRNGEGEETLFTYHPGGALASVTEPDGVWHDFPRYGQQGHWIERGGAAPDQRAFDAAGNPRVPASVERGGGVLSRSWDAERRLAGLEVTASEGGRVTDQAPVALLRRSDGRLLRVERPGGGDHEFVYDAIGRLALRRERVDGVWQDTLFEYDAAGRRTARTRPNGMREEWKYGPYGKLLRHRAFRDGQLEGEALLSWEDGRLAAAYDSLRGTAEVYGYDGAGRRSQVWFGHGEVLELEWDLRSRLVAERLSLPGQGVILELEYEYDLADREVAIRADGEELVRRSFADGLLASTRYGNGIVRDLAYEPDSGLLSSATSTDALGELVELTQIARSAEVGPSRSQIATWTTTPRASTAEEHWLGLGTSPAHPDQRVGKRVFGWRGEVEGDSVVQAFAYDLLGNPAADADGDLFSTNAEGNRLLSATLVRDGVTLDYSWDAAGFASSRAGLPITWSATGRLASYGDASVEWDMQGRLISWSAQGVTRDFSLFGGRVDRDPESGVLGSLDLGEVAIGFGGTRRYRHDDFRGNVRFVSDEAGLVQSHYLYGPYGVDAVFGVDGGEALAGGRALGELVWLGERIYDPAVGRFLSPDPVFQLVNQYDYAMGNPIWFSDPDGTNAGPTGEDVAIDGISLALATAAVFTVTATTPAWATGLALVAFYWSAVNFLVSYESWSAASQRGAGAKGGSADPGSVSSSELGLSVPSAPGSGPAFSGGFGFGSLGPAGCAPTRLGAIPDLGWLLYGLVPIQLLAGLALLRRRGRPRRSPS